VNISLLASFWKETISLPFCSQSSNILEVKFGLYPIAKLLCLKIARFSIASRKWLPPLLNLYVQLKLFTIRLTSKHLDLSNNTRFILLVLFDKDKINEDKSLKSLFNIRVIFSKINIFMAFIIGL